MGQDHLASAMTNRKASGMASAGNSTKSKEAWAKTDLLRYFPRSKEEFDNVEQLAEDFVFTEHGPSSPIFDSNSNVLTMGSCFAMELRSALKSMNKNSDYIHVPEGLNNSFAVRQWLEWVLTGDRSSDAHWYDNDPVAGAFKWEPKEEQQKLLEHFKKTDAFVVTFGLAEVWRDKKTKGVFWRGVPAKVFDPNIHECVTSTVQENVDNMKRIYQLIKQYAGSDKKIIFTLSPVPLNATFVGRPTIVSDCVSKSTLRVALDQFFREINPSDCYYWPSFEMVRWVGSHVDFPTLWEDNTPRHVKRSIVEIIIKNFIKKFFVKDKK
jgi:hypothetical protein